VTQWTITTRLLCSWDSPGKNTGMCPVTPGNLPDPEIEPISPVSLALLSGFFITKHHKGSPRILKWVVYLKYTKSVNKILTLISLWENIKDSNSIM